MRYLTNRKPEDIIKLKLFEKNWKFIY
jgi:hypothetical protein